ncbi:MAG: hypothetical protein H6587_02450 [Flavobacteriales bacterium]|nr:hypothetical protein [Flavobacteriales bacterium]
MNIKHRFTLEKGSKKYNCPDCNKRTFVFYVDNETNNYLPELYGRCDRESKCSYHLNPYKDGYIKMITDKEQGQNVDNWKPYQQNQIKKPLTTIKTTFIPVEVLNKTLSNYEQNNFIQNLLKNIPFPFMVADIEKIVSLYRLGTISKGYRNGAITFPFIDIKNNVRAIQVKQFDKTNHTTGTDFLHSIIEKHHTRNNKPLPEWLEAYTKQDKRITCLFGEHLLSKYHSNPVALVEAPKTAIYSTLYFGLPEQPQNLLWLAVFNLSSLNLNRCKALKGRNVFLFPDLSKDGKAFDLWSNKAKAIESQLKGSKFIVSNLLERLAPERDKEQGNDLADYLIKQDWRLFRKQEIKELPQPKREPVKQIEPLNDKKDISEIETYFKNKVLPKAPIRLNKYSIITDVSLFVENHFSLIEANNEKQFTIPYLHRLQELKQVL